MTHIFSKEHSSIKGEGRRWDFFFFFTEMPLFIRQRAEMPLKEGSLCPGRDLDVHSPGGTVDQAFV